MVVGGGWEGVPQGSFWCYLSCSRILKLKEESGKTVCLAALSLNRSLFTPGCRLSFFFFFLPCFFFFSFSIHLCGDVICFFFLLSISFNLSYFLTKRRFSICGVALFTFMIVIWVSICTSKLLSITGIVSINL